MVKHIGFAEVWTIFDHSKYTSVSETVST